MCSVFTSLNHPSLIRSPLFPDSIVHSVHSDLLTVEVTSPLYTPARCVLSSFLFHSIENHNLSVFTTRGSTEYGRISCIRVEEISAEGTRVSRGFCEAVYAWVASTRS